MRMTPAGEEILGNIDLETKTHIVEICSARKGKRRQVERQLRTPQLNRGKQVILYAANYSRNCTEMVDGAELLKGAVGPAGERALVVRDGEELAAIIKAAS